MKIKIKELLNMVPILNKLTAQDIPIATTGYDIMDLLDEMSRELKTYHKTKSKLDDKYATINEKTKQRQIVKEKIEKYTKELNKLHDREIEVKSRKIKVSLLGKKADLSVNELRVIKLITER